MGLPVVHRLVERYPGRASIWPFETGWDTRLHGIVVAEIWPSLVPSSHVAHPIKDARQVTAVCEWALKADAAGELRAAFARPADLSDTEAALCVAEEGWILGLGTGLA